MLPLGIGRDANTGRRKYVVPPLKNTYFMESAKYMIKEHKITSSTSRGQAIVKR